MKALQRFVVLMLALFATTPSWGFDEDEFECKTSTALQQASLSCVSCGIQKFYAKKNQTVIPSEKWLTSLGVILRQRTESLVRNRNDSRAHFQKALARYVQVYGFCTDYKSTSKKCDPKDRECMRSRDKELSSEEWNTLRTLLNRDQIPPEKVGEAAKDIFGYKAEG
ncbi:MAG: tetratricopeptide repeat protein, partial [Bdellovibrio sp.]